MGDVDGKMGNWLSELYIEVAWRIPRTSVNGVIIGGNIAPHGKKLIYGRIRLLESNLNSYNQFQHG